WCVAFSSDSKRIVSGSDDATVRVWDARTGGLKLTLGKHSGSVIAVAFSPDGETIAAGTGRWVQKEKMHLAREVKVWDARTGQEKRSLEGHTGGVGAVAFSTGTRLASVGSDETIKVWDTTTWQHLGTLKTGMEGLCAVAFSADGKHLLFAGDYLATVLHLLTSQVTRIFLGGRALSLASVAIS